MFGKHGACEECCVEDQPVGWCSIAPREEFSERINHSHVFKPVDNKPVWSILCFYVHTDFRNQGIAKQLLRDAIAFARHRVPTLEAFPKDFAGRASDAAIYIGISIGSCVYAYQKFIGGVKMSEALRNSVKAMVKETFEGPPVPVKGSWFTNSEPNSGIFGVLEGISCDQASLSVYGTTLAAHTDHVCYHMWGTNEIIKKGKQPEMDWEKSWDIHSVDEQQWNRIQEGLRDEYLTLLESIDAMEWNERLANEVLSSLAHSVYHLGAIRQMLKRVKM